jgi:hypothetical protein
MSYYLVRLEPDPSEPGKCFDVPIPDHGPFEKGSDAAKVAKSLTELLGYKVQPRRMSQAADWRERQAKRLADGVITPLPKKWDLEPVKDHFAHLEPEKHPGMICFTENDELGVLDRVTVLSPGRYISRFYETEGKMDDDRRRKLITQIDPSGELLYAWTPEEISRVYKEGPSSCMDGAHSFSTPVWPPAVYGAGDLALAYTVNNKGRIQSRCLVWPEKKLYGRIYGDVQRMQQQLEDEGYETERCDVQTADGNGAHFIGAKILKVPMKDPFYAVMPYFDDIGICVDGGEYWITAAGEPWKDDELKPDMVFSGGTSGYTRIRQYCPRTEEYHDKSSFKPVNGVDQQWSSRARDLFCFTCEMSGEVWPREHKVTLRDGTYVSRKWFADNGMVCEATGQNIRKSEAIEFEGKMVSNSYKRKVEYERQDAQRRAERHANWDRNQRFYEAVEPMLHESMIRRSDFADAIAYRPVEPHYSRELERMTLAQYRDLMMARPIEHVFIAADPAAPIEEQTVQYETHHTVDGQRIVTRRVA